MHRNPAVLVVEVLTASLSGCQLIEALLPDGVGSRSTGETCATYQVVATDEQDVTAEMLEQARVGEHGRPGTQHAYTEDGEWFFPGCYADDPPDDHWLWVAETAQLQPPGK